MIKLNNNKITTTTIFPDHTSQVWKIPEGWFHFNYNTIAWEFETEAEFMQVAQLSTLLRKRYEDIKCDGKIILNLDTLPYANQAKEISNTTAFALHTFVSLLKTLKFDDIKVVDSQDAKLFKELIKD